MPKLEYGLHRVLFFQPASSTVRYRKKRHQKRAADELNQYTVYNGTQQSEFEQVRSSVFEAVQLHCMTKTLDVQSRSYVIKNLDLNNQ